MEQNTATINQLIAQILDEMRRIGYSETTIWRYYQPAMGQFRKYYGQTGQAAYSPEITDEYISLNKERYERGEVTYQSFKKTRYVGRRMNEFFLSGQFRYTSQKRGTSFMLSEGNERIVDQFLCSRSCGDKSRYDAGWTVRKYLQYMEKRGHASLSDVTHDEVREFILKTAASIKTSGLHNVLLYLKHFHIFLVYLPVHRKLSGNTVTTYRTVLNQFLAHVAGAKGIPVMAVTFDMVNAGSVNACLDSLTGDRGLSSSTRNNRLAVLRAFVSYAAACRPEYISLSGELSAIKVRKSDRFAKVDYMTEKAVEALLKEPDTRTAIGLRDQMIMVMLYDTGARIQEALGIRLCGLRLDRTPTAQLFGKGRKIRTVPLMANTVGKLKNYISVFHKRESMLSEKPLFYVERKGQLQPICDDTVRIRIQKYADAAREKCGDVPETVYPHLWRHTRAMHLYQHGMDLTLISQWLGHASLETTLVYAHADTEAKRKAIEKAMGSGTGAPEDSSSYTIDDEDLLKQLYGL